MNFYLIKYRVTTANIIANTVETYQTIEDVEAKYYENIVDAITNINLKYVMLSMLDSDGNDIKHIDITCPGEQEEIIKYCLIKHIIKTDKTTTEELLTFDNIDAAKLKIKEDQNMAKEDTTIVSLKTTLIDTNGVVENIETVNGAGFVNYRSKYLVFVNKFKTDKSLNPNITRYNSLHDAEVAVYRLISDSIDDITLLYLEYRIEDAYGNTVAHEIKKCKGELPIEEENQENTD